MKRLLLILLLFPALAFAQVDKFIGHSTLAFSTDLSGYPPKPFANIWDCTGDTGRLLDPDTSGEILWPVSYTDTTGTVVVDSALVLFFIRPSVFGDSCLPTGICFWQDQNNYTTPDPIRWGWPGQLSSTVTLASIDSVRAVAITYLVDSLDQFESGSGPYPDSIFVLASGSPVGLAEVWAYPNGGGYPLKGQTDANGLVLFAALHDTMNVYGYSAGYSQISAPLANVVDSTTGYGLDTLYMSPFVAGSPPAPGLTQIIFYVYDGAGNSVNYAIMDYQLWTQGESFVYHMDSSKVFDPTKVHRVRGDDSGTITVNVVPNDSILVAGGRTGVTRWTFRVYSPLTGLPLLGDDGRRLNVPASDTSLVYPRDRAAFGD